MTRGRSGNRLSDLPRRTPILVVGLPLVGGLIGVGLVLAGYLPGVVLTVFALPVALVNYRRLKTMRRS